MSRPRLYVPPERLAAELVVLEDADAHYLGRVLRLGLQEQVVLFDGRGGEAEAEIVVAGREQITLKVVRRLQGLQSHGPRVVLIQALLKGERFALVVQKATELGVAGIWPVVSARTVERLDGARAESRLRRWDKIAREAARQCGRADVPEIGAPTSLAAALGAASPAALRLLLWEDARLGGRTLKQALVPSEMWPLPAEFVVAVGPEGGFTAAEVQLGQDAGFTVVGLGPRVLRAETAALAILSVVGFVLGDLGG